MTTYDAILPAGGEIDPMFAAKVGTANKALIQFGSQTILEHVIQALRESKKIRRIVVIGPKEVHAVAHGKADLLLEPAATGPDNIMKGLDALANSASPPDKVVVSTTDLPFLTANIVSRFIEMCPEDTDICLPLITKAQYQERFPGSDSTFVQLRDNIWTAGCLYLLDVQSLRACKPHIDRIFEVRKSKVGMARLLGIKFLYKFLTKSLSVQDVETKIATLLHCSGKAILDSPPELAFDIDYEDDYDFALKSLNR